MKDGWIQQVGEPLEVYSHSANWFVDTMRWAWRFRRHLPRRWGGAKVHPTRHERPESQL